MNLKTPLALILVAVLSTPLGLGLGLAGEGPSSDPDAAPMDETALMVTDHSLETAPGVTIHFTVFRPGTATAADPTPLILHSHGWGGSRATSLGGLVGDLTTDGYGVLSIDQRGHGASSDSHATIMHKDHEVQDMIQILDWAYDHLEWVEREGDPADKDLVLGAVGGSYGGAYQLMLASHDGRLDALAPQMTWNDLGYSLAPNGVIKSTWVAALYGFGIQGVNMHPDIHDWLVESTVTNRMPAAASDHFVGSSPLPDQITAPTLLVQGFPDALFNWNEAWHNFNGIASAGTEVSAVGYLGGHVLPFPGQPVGMMGPTRDGEPCGAYDALALSWFARHLRGDPEVEVPIGIHFSLEDGRCIAVEAPETMGSHRLGFDLLPAPNTAGTILVPLDAPAGILAGVPHLDATFNGATETILTVGLAKMADDGRIHFVDDQTAFARIAPPVGQVSSDVDLEMTGVATDIGPGERLFLRIDGLHEWAPLGAGRTPGGGLFTDVVVTLPYVE